jgi:PAS domain-containing protein
MTDASYERAVVRAILEHPHVSVIATGQDGIIRFFNKGAENLLGYTAEEMVGKQKSVIIADPAEAAEHAAELSREYGVAVGAGREGIITGPTLTGEPEDRVWTYIRKDGGRRKVLMSLNILRDEGGKMQGYIGISIPLPES